MSEEEEKEEDWIKSFACKVIPFLSNVSCGIQSKSTLYTPISPQDWSGVCTVALFPSIASNNPLNERGIIPGFPASPKTVCVYHTSTSHFFGGVIPFPSQ